MAGAANRQGRLRAARPDGQPRELLRRRLPDRAGHDDHDDHDERHRELGAAASGLVTRRHAGSRAAEPSSAPSVRPAATRTTPSRRRPGRPSSSAPSTSSSALAANQNITAVTGIQVFLNDTRMSATCNNSRVRVHLSWDGGAELDDRHDRDAQPRNEHHQRRLHARKPRRAWLRGPDAGTWVGVRPGQRQLRRPPHVDGGRQLRQHDRDACRRGHRPRLLQPPDRHDDDHDDPPAEQRHRAGGPGIDAAEVLGRHAEPGRTEHPGRCVHDQVRDPEVCRERPELDQPGRQLRVAGLLQLRGRDPRRVVEWRDLCLRRRLLRRDDSGRHRRELDGRRHRTATGPASP